MFSIVVCDRDECKYNENNYCVLDLIKLDVFGQCVTDEEGIEE